MTVFKRKNRDGSHSYGYRFRDRFSKRYVREMVPLARTKWQAEQAEKKRREAIFNERYGLVEVGGMLFSDFVENDYMPWARLNKRSWRDDAYITPVLKENFKGKTLREISPQSVEQFKGDRLLTDTKKDTARAPATVNRELNVLSRVFTLAIEYGKADANPCGRVKLLPLDNQRYRYLLPEEEPRLMAALVEPREHLKPIIIVALGTGMRRGEQFNLKRGQVDFLRGIVTARKTKNGKHRDIPMNPDVRAVFSELCRGKGPDDYVFTSPKTGKRITDVKKSFHKALEIAEIDGLTWHDLRATFGTRLGDAGCDAFTIAQLMGHSDIRMTARYVRGTERGKRAAVTAAMLKTEQSGHILVTQEKRQTA